MIAAALLLSSAVALSFDDLPGNAIPLHDRCKPAAVEAWNAKLLGVLRKHHAPAIGFVNAGSQCMRKDLPRILDMWLREGHQLGNHTAHHIDANAVSAEAFEKDVIAGEVPGYTFRWFRYPMLHTGETAAKRDAIAAFLEKRGYRNGVVTLDSDEYLYNNAYATVYPEHAQLVARAYLEFMESIVDFYEKRTNEVVGRPIPHVLLLHMSSLNADHLDELLTMFERRGYRFITIDEAMKDPAYSLKDGYAGKKGLSWIHRWGLGKGLPVVSEPAGKVP